MQKHLLLKVGHEQRSESWTSQWWHQRQSFQMNGLPYAQSMHVDVLLHAYEWGFTIAHLSLPSAMLYNGAQ